MYCQLRVVVIGIIDKHRYQSAVDVLILVISSPSLNGGLDKAIHGPSKLDSQQSNAQLLVIPSKQTYLILVQSLGQGLDGA